MCHWSLFISRLLSETGRASENEPKFQLKTAFFWFAGSCFLKDRVKLPSRFKKGKKKVMKLWWFPPFSTNIHSRVDDDRNLWKFHQNHDNDAQAHRTLAATLDIWPCDGRVPLSKGKKKALKPNQTESFHPRCLLMSVCPPACEDVKTLSLLYAFVFVRATTLLTSETPLSCAGGPHTDPEEAEARRPSPRSSWVMFPLTGLLRSLLRASSESQLLSWLSLSCATNCREFVCPCWSPGIFRVCLANASCFVP